jgi:ATP-binding cassette, subfamily B, bacterial
LAARDISAVSLPLSLIGPRLILPRAASRGIEARRLDAEVLDAVQENLTTQPTIKALGMERQAIARIGMRLEKFAQANRRFNFLSYVAERTPNITILLFHVVILAVGAKMACGA